MLYNLDFLAVGQTFPPRGELERLQDYKDNILLFDGDSYEVYKETIRQAGRDLDRSMQRFGGLFGRFVEINYYRLNTLATADLLCGEMPVITIQDETKQQVLNDMLHRWGWSRKLYAAAMDISRLGDAALRVYRGEDGKSRLAQYAPSTVYKVVSDEDHDDVQCLVHATVRNFGTDEKPSWELHAQIHDRGQYTNRVYALEPCKELDAKIERNGRVLTNLQCYKIKALLDEGASIPVKTDTDGFALTTLHQVQTADRVWGRSDYDVMDSIMAELWKRIGQISIILDANAAPDMAAGIDAFTPNADGTYRLKTAGIGGGNTWVVGDDQPIPQYITWDGNLTAAFSELDMLLKQMYKLTEMGAVFEASAGGSNIAYETMRAAFARPLAKVRRISNGIESAVKETIINGLQIDGVDVDASDINITWCDGLPNDEQQEINKATALVNGGFTTPEHENINRFGLTKEQSEQLAEEVSAWSADKQASMFGGFGGGVTDGGEE